MKRLTVGAVLPGAVLASIVFAASCAVPVSAKDYGHDGVMGYGPMQPFDESVPIPRPVPCKDGKCTLDQKFLADLLKKVYEEGKHDAQAVCGSRT